MTSYPLTLLVCLIAPEIYILASQRRDYGICRSNFR